MKSARNIFKFGWPVATGMLLLLSTPAFGISLTVPNPSFESPALADSFGVLSVSGWVPGSFSGTRNPSAAELPGGVPDGHNIMFGTATATLSSVLAVGTYTLNYYVGYRVSYTGGSFNYAAAEAGFVGIATTGAGPQPPAGTMVPASLVFSILPGHLQLGQTLRITLGSSGVPAYFDKVSLDFEPPASASVPEGGSTLALSAMAFALVGLLARQPRGASSEGQQSSQ